MTHDLNGTPLDMVITSLQKSFSRVNRDAALRAKERPEEPVAKLDGDLNFEIRTHVNPDADHTLMVCKDGCIALTISGTIDQDQEVSVSGIETEELG